MTGDRRTLAAVNAMPDADFVAAFGDVAEHAPWVAAKAARLRPFRDRMGMGLAFIAAIASAPRADQLALIRAHPDLAGRAARAGDLTADSRSEQAGAGLDTLSEAEFARFTELNTHYGTRFGFPFILAVEGATKHTILEAFEARIDNDEATEFTTALGEIARIVLVRIEGRVGD